MKTVSVFSKLLLLGVLVLSLSACEVFRLFFRGLAAIGDAPKVALLEQTAMHPLGGIATPGARIHIVGINREDRGVPITEIASISEDGYISRIQQSPMDEFLIVEHFEAFAGHGEFRIFIFENISGRTEFFATDNTLYPEVEARCLMDSETYAEGVELFESIEDDYWGEPLVLIDDIISNSVNSRGWLARDQIVLSIQLELIFAIRTPDGRDNYYPDDFRSRNGETFYLVLQRDSSGTWAVTGCEQDSPDLPTFTPSHAMTIRDGVVYIDGARFENTAGEPVIAGPIESLSGPFRP